MITLVLGGSGSGKSSIAERMAAKLPQPVTYVATGVATDGDMAARIQAHQERRPPAWRLLEATGEELCGALYSVEGTVLLDALGTWVASLAAPDESHAVALCETLLHRTGDTLVVSDEVGLGVHPSTAVGRKFRDDLGRVNRGVAAVADEVFLVVAGRMLRLDGADA